MADRSSLIESGPRLVIQRVRALGRSLAEIDQELDHLTSTMGPTWVPPLPERLTVAKAQEALDALAQGVPSTLPIADALVSVAATAESEVPVVMEFGSAEKATVDVPAVVANESPVAASPPESEPSSEVAPTASVPGAPDVIEPSVPEVIAIAEVRPQEVVAAVQDLRADEGLSLIDEEPEFVAAAQEPDVEAAVDTDDVLVIDEPVIASPPVVTKRPVGSRASEGDDLGELMFELEPELNVGVPEARAAVPRLTISSSNPARARELTTPPKISTKSAPRSVDLPENLELDLSELLSDGKAPSVRPPPLLRPPPPPPQRSAPPPVPRFSKQTPEPDLVELIDENEVEVVRASSGPPSAVESKVPPPLPGRST